MIRLKPGHILLPLLLSASHPAAALQVLEVRDGGTVLGRISQKELTRISFAHDRIRKVTGNAGEFLLEKDEDRGAIFIRPVSAESTKPINLFVSSGRSTVALLLQPVDIPGDSIVLREPRASVTGSRTAQSTQHVRALKNLLLTMAADALPEDMTVRESGRELMLRPGVRLTLQRSWLGSGIVGEKYLLTNTGAGELQLAESDFYKPGVLAVSLELASLQPGAATNLFVIRERHAHD